MHGAGTFFFDSPSTGRTVQLLRYLCFAVNSHQLSPSNNKTYAFFSPAKRHPTSCTCVCNSIEDPASLVDAQLSNQQPTHKQLVRRSNGATPMYGSVHPVATFDAAHIHGCRVQSAVFTAGFVWPTKIGICTFAGGALPRLLARIEISQARGTDKVAQFLQRCPEEQRRPSSFPFHFYAAHAFNTHSHQHRYP